MAIQHFFKSNENNYPETCLVMRQYRLEWLIYYMENKNGLERVKAVAEYQSKAKEYNNIVGYKCYDVNYDPLNAPSATNAPSAALAKPVAHQNPQPVPKPMPRPAAQPTPVKSASSNMLAFLKPKPKTN